MKYKKHITYARLTEDGKFFIGFTIADCQRIDHLLGHSGTGNWHEGTFYNTTLSKLERIAEMHGYILRYEELYFKKEKKS